MYIQEIKLYKNTRNKKKTTYCVNSMLMEAAESLAMSANARLASTNVVPFLEGVEFSVAAWSTIVTCTLWPTIQAPGVIELRHLTKYCRPHEAPLSHIASPAAANRLSGGNCSWSLPWHVVAEIHKKYIFFI